VRRYDLIIVGGSFAGLACARTAASRGLKVAVIERKSEAGEGVRTTGILVKEAAEETDIPSHLTRLVRGVRLYAPNGKHIDHSAPGYYFLATDTPNLMRWMAAEAARAGAEILFSTPFKGGVQADDGVQLPNHEIGARLLIGADGPTSAVARAFGLDSNRRFLAGVEFELEPDDDLDGRFLHCFLDSALAPGYIAWAVPGVGVTQVGLAASGGKRPDARAFLDAYIRRLKLKPPRVVGRRSGLIPAGATLTRTFDGRVMLIGDAAGHVSPLTGGGIVQTLRLGRRTAQLASDWIQAGGEHPARALAREAPRFRRKLLMRRMLDLAPPNWVWNLAIGTAPFRAFAQSVYFHRRGGGSEEQADRALTVKERTKDERA
jgi:digeranylgeranylglycerophospholipid reductase